MIFINTFFPAQRLVRGGIFKLATKISLQIEQGNSRHLLFSSVHSLLEVDQKMAGVIRQLRPTLRLLAKVNSTAPVRTYAEAATKDMPLTFASANQVFYDETDVKQIDVPTFSGVIGILPKHVPILAVLSPGIVTVFDKEGGSKKIFVSSGTLCVNEDSSVQVLAEEAHNIEDLDLNAAKDSLAKAQSELSSAPSDKKEEAAIAAEIAESIVKALG